MKKITFVLDTDTLPSMADYSSITVKVPTLFKLSDGSGGLKLDTFNYYWVNQQQMNNLLVQALEEEPKSTQADPGKVSEATLLKAIAICQQPELAMNLLKE